MNNFYKILLLILFSVYGYGQKIDSLLANKKDVKVGLVLSGGGAKGLAHIGVLKLLEEHGVRIDYIGGTSMGAMIGGLYASGYNATQLDSIFRVTDFDEILQDNIPRRLKSFYDKENDEKYTLTLPFNKFKMGIPIAFTKGHNVYNLFSRLMYNSRFIKDFNALSIPFLCAATDIETGEMIILNSGNLPLSVSASGSFPTLFAPVKINNRYLTDGGIVNNYPIDQVKVLGADIIIGVDVQSELFKSEEITSAAQVVMQIINFQMLEDANEKRLKTDIHIKPDIKNFNVISFNDGQEIVQNGIEAAEPFIDVFKRIAENQKTKKEAPQIQNNELLDCISEIEINGVNNYSNSYILGKLRFDIFDDITFDKFSEGFQRLKATQNFDNIVYHFKKNSDGNDKLVIDIEENKNKTFLKLGLHYDELLRSSVLLNVTHKNLLIKNDVISADIILGDNVRYNFDYYVDNGFYLSYGFRSRFVQFGKNVKADLTDYLPNVDNVNKIRISYHELTNQMYLQTLFRQIFLVGVGVEHKVIDVESESVYINNQEFNDYVSKFNFLSTYAYLTLDTFDKKYFPSKGIYFDSNFKWILNSTEFSNSFGRYSIGQATLSTAKSFFDKITLRTTAETGFTIGRSNGVLDFIFGGYGFAPIYNIKPFFGYDSMSIRGNSFIKGEVGLDYEFIKKHHINFYANYANVGDDIYDKFSSWLTNIQYSGYTAGYGFETVLGPIEAKYTWSPEIRSSFWWINVGFWF